MEGERETLRSLLKGYFQEQPGDFDSNTELCVFSFFLMLLFFPFEQKEVKQNLSVTAC